MVGWCKDVCWEEAAACDSERLTLSLSLLSLSRLSGVFGRVTTRSLRQEMGLESASEQYSVGDALSCQVVHVKEKSKRRIVYSGEHALVEDHPYYEITLSLQAQSEEGDEESEKDAEAHIRTGAVLPPKALRVVEIINTRIKDGSIVPGYAIVEVEAKSVMNGKSAGKMIECKLPFDQLFDMYEENSLRSPKNLNKLGKKVLVVGEKIDQKSIILTDPKKSSMEYKRGTGRLTVVSLRPQLIRLAEKGKE